MPYVSLLLAGWHGDAGTAAELSETMARGASERGEGAALTYADYANAVLGNGLGDYAAAARAAHDASVVDEIVISPWALYELVEAAARSDQHERAAAAADRLSQIAAACGGDWARGAAARSRALVSGGRLAEDLYRQAIELLGRTRMATHLARARLCYGEWLRRENRRIDARNQLRLAFDAFSSMGADGFAERARRELRATGAKARRRTDDTRADLTPQEEEIAGLARDGRTNAEDRRPALHRRPHRRMAPAQGLRQAGHQLPPRARRGAEAPAEAPERVRRGRASRSAHASGR